MTSTLPKQLLIAFAALAATTLWAEKSTTIDVTTVIADTDGSGELLMRSDDYNGAQHATYTAVDEVTSMIDTTGAWKLYLGAQSVRTVYLTPNAAVGTQPAGPPAGLYWKDVEAYSQCFDQSNNQVPLQNLVNGSGACSLGVDFYAAKTKYKLVMSPHLPAKGPATGVASVACGAVTNNACVSWTISPNTAAPNVGVANLYAYAANGSLVFVGQYYNTFRINVTNP